MSQYLAVGHVATYNCDGSRERELSALSPYISGKGVGNGELAEVPPKAEPEMRISSVYRSYDFLYIKFLRYLQNFLKLISEFS